MLDFYEKINLFEDEEVKGVFRQSSVVVIKGVVLPILALFALFLFMFPLFRAGGGGVLFFFIVLAVIAVFILHHVAKWYGTLFVVTNKRIFRIMRHGLFKKDVDEIAVESVNGISYAMKGVLDTIFKAGTVHITYKDTSRAETLIPLVYSPASMLDVVSRLLHGKSLPSEMADPVEVHGHEIKKDEGGSLGKPMFKEREIKKNDNSDNVDIATIWNE